LRIELEQVRSQLAELEATANALGTGKVDAIMVEGLKGKQLYTIHGPTDPYRILIERMNEGAATLTAEGVILFGNRRLAEMMELSPELLADACLPSRLCKFHPCSLLDLLQLAIKYNISTETNLLRMDGTLLPVVLSVSLVASSESEQVFCLVISDNSEVRNARRGLQEQAEIFELAHDAILVYGLDGRILSWNRGAKDLYGWSAEEAIGALKFDLLRTEFPESAKVVPTSLRERKEWEGELTHTCRDGRAIKVASRWTLLRDEAGDPTAVLEIDRDITESRRMELELQKGEEAYRTLADRVPQLIWRASPDGLNVYFNKQWVDYTGQSAADGRGNGWEDPFHPDDRESVWNAWNHSVRTGQDYKCKARLRSANGIYRWFLAKGLPLLDGQGNIVEWFGSCTDIDDLKRAEEEIQILNRELESRVELRTLEAACVNAQLAASVKELEAFAYSVSHDLRAPLRHLDGFLTLLCKSNYASLDEMARHYVDCALASSQRMGQLIDELLQFSRLGRDVVNGTPADLNTVIEEVRRELEPEIGNRKIIWHLDCLPRLIGDQAMLRQVIQNLLGNALKFTRQCEVAEISIGFRPGNNNEVVIFVRDNGAGFDMRYSNKLFQVFQRLHGEDEFEGTGIGLAIVRRIVERHGGRVWAEGSVGAGATFYFSLPSDSIDDGGLHERFETNLVS
jgi:PAS domain S-box-containing protein